MFGIYRFLLSLMVLLTHLGGFEIFAGQAVWAFFMLSGFLITGVLNRRYGFTTKGVTEFTFSRALRLMPTYWLSVLLALAVIMLFAGVLDPRMINSSFAQPANVMQWFSAFTILGQSAFGLGRAELSPSPSAWAVEVEIFLYVCSCLWVSRSRKNALVTTLVTIGLFPVLYVASKFLFRAGFSDYANQLTYSFLPAALIPYAVGSLIWHSREKLAEIKLSVLTAGLAVAGVVVCAKLVSQISVIAAYVLSVPVFAYINIGLSNIKPIQAVKRWDDFLGHMSYPVYLMHWICAYLFVLAVKDYGEQFNFWEIHSNGLLLLSTEGFLIATAVTIVFSALIAWLFEIPIERHRRTVAVNLAGRFFSASRYNSLDSRL